MITHRSCINLFKYLLGPLLLVLLIRLTPAFSASITMEYFLGFNGLFTLHRWTPLNVILENRGRTTKGTLEVVVTSGSEYFRDVRDTTYSMDVELPTNSKKLYSFTILIDSFTHPLIIRLRQPEKTILSTSVNLRPHYTTKSLILVLGNGIAPDFLSLLPKDVLPIIPRPQFLPETWCGYGGVKMLILDANDLANFRKRQFFALIDWIKKGGYLITTGGLNYGAFLKERTSRLLPVTIAGFKRFFELNSLEEFCGQRFTSTDPFLVLEADIEESVTLVKENDIPIITQKDIGLGRVIFLAFDCQRPPFTDWPGRLSFWSKILALRPQVDCTSTDLEEQKILSSMISEIPTRFPGFLSALAFLAVYVILVYIIFRRFRKNSGHSWKDLSYLMTVIVVFSIASFWLFYNKNAQTNLSYNSFLYLKLSDQDMIASSKHIIGLYSVRKGEYRLNLGPTFHPVTPIFLGKPKDETQHSLTLDEKNGEQTVLISLDRWSHQFIKMNSMIDFPIRGEAFMDEQGLVIMIENLTPHTIIDCQIYFTNNLIFLGDIAPCKKQVKRLSRPVIGQKGLSQIQVAGLIVESNRPNAHTFFLENMKQNIIEDILPSIHSRHHSRRDAIHLFGWITSDVVPISLMRPGISGEGVALIEWEIRVSSNTKKIRTGLFPDYSSDSETAFPSRVFPLEGVS